MNGNPLDTVVSNTSTRMPSTANRLLARIKGINRLFLLSVAVPTLLAIIYFGLIASDVYISESRFVVRSPDKQSTTGLGALLQGAGFSKAQDDSYAVHDYILSRDALQKLQTQFDISQAYGSKNVDIFSRFGGLDWDTSFEALLRYYQKHITVDADTASSISTLTVKAYTSQDAYNINESLLEMSEKLVNQLNERGRQDMIRFATAEVADAENQAKKAALAVSRYRDQKNVFDPAGQSALQLQLVSKLQDQLITTKNQLSQIQSITRDNPQIPALKRQVESLQADITTETAKVAGAGSSLSNKAVEYERLKLESLFADKQLATAFASLEQARNEAQRKQFYLERIVQPNKPDTAIEPRRLRAILATFALGMLLWGVLSIMVAGVREHHDR
jgi:capsular polysaccharide transport system permease protein